MDSENNARPRRNFKTLVIDPFKQMKFGLYVMGISVTFLAIFAYLFVDAFTDQYQHVMGIFNVVDPTLQWEIVTNDVFKMNAIRVGIFFALYIGGLFWAVFRLTHRYYGPLVSIRRFVSQMNAGDYSARCSIRKKDELLSLVSELNAMAESIEKRHEETKISETNDATEKAS